MSEFLDFPTLIAIGVAIVVLLRLRSVLGTRTGNERRPSDRISGERSAEKKPGNDDNVVEMPRRQGSPDQPEGETERYARKLEAEIELFAHGDQTLAAGLKDVAEADSTFMPKSFLEGAKSAYEMIVTAFAQGDRKTLKNLLEKDVYEGFEAAITEREAAGRKVDFTFVGLPKVEITEASVDKRVAQITIEFNAEVVSATYEADGTLVEGNAEHVVSIADEWTFARNTRSRDPNWKLVATNQLD